MIWLKSRGSQRIATCTNYQNEGCLFLHFEVLVKLIDWGWTNDYTQTSNRC